MVWLAKTFAANATRFLRVATKKELIENPGLSRTLFLIFQDIASLISVFQDFQ